MAAGALPAFNKMNKKDIEKLEKVQKSAARYATNTYMQRTPGTVTKLPKDLQWESLEHQRSFARLQCRCSTRQTTALY